MASRVFVSPAPVIGALPCIVCCTAANENWNWLVEELAEKPRQWYFCSEEPRGSFASLPVNFAAIRASWRSIRLVKRHRADLLLTGNGTIAFWCALFAMLQGVKVDHVVTSFHLPKLPKGVQYLLAQWAYSTVNRLIVHSKAEQKLYGKYFGIPGKRFEMQYQGFEAPTVGTVPLETGDYICALYDNTQDFSTLMAAIAQLPQIPLVLVVGRGQVIRAFPPNVEVRVGLSPLHTANILYHSRFLVLPLRHSHLCNPTALVIAMHLGKTFVVPELPSVSDYAFHNSNALLYQPANPDALAGRILDLWNDLLKCKILGENGREFADAFCSSRSVQKHFHQLLVRRGL